LIEILLEACEKVAHLFRSAQNGHRVGDQLAVPIRSRHLQLVTSCHQLAAFFDQTLLELVPVLARRLVIRLLS
jgi:hypothetical protein